MDSRLRTQVLMPSLLRCESISERLIDVVRFSKLRNLTSLKLPKGNLTEGWVVVTDLRIFILSIFEHVYTEGNTKYRSINTFCQSFLYVYLKDFTLVETGRVRVRHSLRVEREEGAGLEVDLPATRVPRLLLVAGSYRLPLKVRVRSNRLGEHLSALAKTSIPLFVWCIPFLIPLSVDGCAAVDRNSRPNDPGAYWRWLEWLTVNYVTAAAVVVACLLALRVLVAPRPGLERGPDGGCARAAAGRLRAGRRPDHPGARGAARWETSPYPKTRPCAGSPRNSRTARASPPPRSSSAANCRSDPSRPHESGRWSTRPIRAKRHPAY